MYSESKMSNWAPFDPAGSAVAKFYWKHWEELEDSGSCPKYFQEDLHPRFFMPVTVADLKTQYAKIPKEFTSGLEGIILLGGSKKQEKTFYGRLFCYGCYWKDCIFIHPFLKDHLKIQFKPTPAPHILNDYKRVGAKIHKADKQGVIIEFTEESLKMFYLRDVFVHEIGHHVDKHFSKNLKKHEGFAEWFATEYGFKFKFYSDA